MTVNLDSEPWPQSYMNDFNFKNEVDFALILLENSSWYTCGYESTATYTDPTYYPLGGASNSVFMPPSVGQYAVTASGNFIATWNVPWGESFQTWSLTFPGGEGAISMGSWNPVSVPDSFVAAYGAADCDYTNTVVNTTENTSLNPGVYCGGIDIRMIGATLTLNPGVYVMRNGNFTMEPALAAGQTGTIDPNDAMPVGPSASSISHTVTGNGVTILFQGSTFFYVFGGALNLTAPTLAASPNFGGLVVYSFDDAPDYPFNDFENAIVTFIGTVDMHKKKFFFASTNVYGDCDLVCLNIGNLWMNNTKFTIYPGQFLSNPQTMALNSQVRRPAYPMIRIPAANAAAAAANAAATINGTSGTSNNTESGPDSH